MTLRSAAIPARMGGSLRVIAIREAGLYSVIETDLCKECRMATKKFQIVNGPDRMGLMVSQYQYHEKVSFTLVPHDGKRTDRIQLTCQITGSARRPRGGTSRELALNFEIEGFSCGGGKDITKKPWQPVSAPWPSDFTGFYSVTNRKGWLEFPDQK